MKKNNKGFTLAELLIVVAIIAVLVAIGIPVFNTALERSRESVDAANMRAGYAEVMQTLLTAADPTAEAGFDSDSTYVLKQTQIADPKGDDNKAAGWTLDVDWPEGFYADSALTKKGVALTDADGKDVKAGVSYKVHVQYVSTPSSGEGENAKAAQDGYYVSLKVS